MTKNRLFTAKVNGQTYKGVTNPYLTEIIFSDLRNNATAIENLGDCIAIWFNDLEIKFKENENGEYKPISALLWDGDCIVDEYEVKGTITRLDRYQMKMAKIDERQKKKERIESFNILKALRLMLQRLDKEEHFDKCVKILLNSQEYSIEQTSKSVYEFVSSKMARELGLLAYIFIIDVDVDRYDAFCNSLKRRFKRFNMFKILKFDDCVIAFD